MPSQPITEEQFYKLLEKVKTEKNQEIKMRDTLMYAILYYLGLRPMECRCIKVEHINFNEKKIFIPAENNKQRQADDIFVPDFLWVRILFYLQKRKAKSKWLFPSCHNQERKTDNPLDAREQQKKFTRRMKELGFAHVSYFDKQGIPRYNLNLYSFRKRFGTFVYKKTRCAKTTANLLRHYDPQLKSVWRYIFTAEKEDRKKLMNQLYN